MSATGDDWRTVAIARPHGPSAASKHVMSLELAMAVARIVELYAVLGIAFALAFLPRGIARVDSRVQASPWAVRVLLLPGVAAFWPLFAWRWLRKRP